MSASGPPPTLDATANLINFFTKTKDLTFAEIALEATRDGLLSVVPTNDKSTDEFFTVNAEEGFQGAVSPQSSSAKKGDKGGKKNQKTAAAAATTASAALLQQKDSTRGFHTEPHIVNGRVPSNIAASNTVIPFANVVLGQHAVSTAVHSNTNLFMISALIESGYFDLVPVAEELLFPPHQVSAELKITDSFIQRVIDFAPLCVGGSVGGSGSTASGTNSAPRSPVAKGANKPTSLDASTLGGFPVGTEKEQAGAFASASGLPTEMVVAALVLLPSYASTNGLLAACSAESTKEPFITADFSVIPKDAITTKHGDATAPDTKGSSPVSKGKESAVSGLVIGGGDASETATAEYYAPPAVIVDSTSRTALLSDLASKHKKNTGVNAADAAAGTVLPSEIEAIIQGYVEHSDVFGVAWKWLKRVELQLKTIGFILCVVETRKATALTKMKAPVTTKSGTDAADGGENGTTSAASAKERKPAEVEFAHNNLLLCLLQDRQSLLLALKNLLLILVHGCVDGCVHQVLDNASPMPPDATKPNYSWPGYKILDFRHMTPRKFLSTSEDLESATSGVVGSNSDITAAICRLLMNIDPPSTAPGGGIKSSGPKFQSQGAAVGDRFSALRGSGQSDAQANGATGDGDGSGGVNAKKQRLQDLGVLKMAISAATTSDKERPAGNAFDVAVVLGLKTQNRFGQSTAIPTTHPSSTSAVTNASETTPTSASKSSAHAANACEIAVPPPAVTTAEVGGRNSSGPSSAAAGGSNIFDPVMLHATSPHHVAPCQVNTALGPNTNNNTATTVAPLLFDAKSCWARSLPPPPPLLMGELRDGSMFTAGMSGVVSGPVNTFPHTFEPSSAAPTSSGGGRSSSPRAASAKSGKGGSSSDQTAVTTTLPLVLDATQDQLAGLLLEAGRAKLTSNKATHLKNLVNEHTWRLFFQLPFLTNRFIADDIVSKNKDIAVFLLLKLRSFEVETMGELPVTDEGQEQFDAIYGLIEVKKKYRGTRGGRSKRLSILAAEARGEPSIAHPSQKQQTASASSLSAELPEVVVEAIKPLSPSGIAPIKPKPTLSFDGCFIDLCRKSCNSEPGFHVVQKLSTSKAPANAGQTKQLPVLYEPHYNYFVYQALVTMDRVPEARRGWLAKMLALTLQNLIIRKAVTNPDVIESICTFATEHSGVSECSALYQELRSNKKGGGGSATSTPTASAGKKGGTGNSTPVVKSPTTKGVPKAGGLAVARLTQRTREQERQQAKRQSAQATPAETSGNETDSDSDGE